MIRGVAGGRRPRGSVRSPLGAVQIAAELAAGSLLLLLNGCLRAPDLLLVVDPYTEAVWQAAGVPPYSSGGPEGERGGAGPGPAGWNPAGWVRAGLSRMGLARAGRTLVQVVPPQQNAVEELRELLSRVSPRGTYLSPLLAQSGIALAGEFPEILFFLDGPIPGAEIRRSNVRVLRYELSAAYERAGKALGALLSMPEPPEALRALASERRGGVVGIVSVKLDKGAEEVLQAFRDGLSLAQGLPETEYRELDNLEDRARARRNLERLRQDGVGLFLLRTSTLTGFCLEVLQKEGGLAITEGEAGIEAYADVLLVTLERDFSEALTRMRAVAAGERSPGGPSPGPPAGAGIIPVPVRLRWWGLSPEEAHAVE